MTGVQTCALPIWSLSLLQGIFPTQGSDPGLPHGRRILYQLSHKKSSIQHPYGCPKLLPSKHPCLILPLPWSPTFSKWSLESIFSCYLSATYPSICKIFWLYCFHPAQATITFTLLVITVVPNRILLSSAVYSRQNNRLDLIKLCHFSSPNPAMISHFSE